MILRGRKCRKVGINHRSIDAYFSDGSIVVLITNGITTNLLVDVVKSNYQLPCILRLGNDLFTKLKKKNYYTSSKHGCQSNFIKKLLMYT